MGACCWTWLGFKTLSEGTPSDVSIRSHSIFTLPPPDGPTSAAFEPGGRSIVTPRSTATSGRDGYENLEDMSKNDECRNGHLVSGLKVTLRSGGKHVFVSTTSSSVP